MMTKTDIRKLIDESVPNRFRSKRPIDPFAIAKAEGLILIPHQDLKGFDGCLHYRADRAVFILHYVDRGDEDPRTRYTISHEMGHYFIPEHQQLLIRGNVHGSNVEDLRADERELEANAFAAHLLCPQHELAAFLADVGRNEVHRIAREFNISISAAARRMIEETDRACAAVFSKDGIIAHALLSDDLVYRGIHGIKKGVKVPADSRTAKQAASSPQPRENRMAVSDWFHNARPWRQDDEIWEEVIPLGAYGVLTLLTYEPDEENE